MVLLLLKGLDLSPRSQYLASCSAEGSVCVTKVFPQIVTVKKKSTVQPEPTMISEAWMEKSIDGQSIMHFSTKLRVPEGLPLKGEQDAEQQRFTDPNVSVHCVKWGPSLARSNGMYEGWIACGYTAGVLRVQRIILE